jgi:GNAT superfamily N-acetyltransferase
MIRAAIDADTELVRELRDAFAAEVPDLPWREDDDDGAQADLVLLSDEDGIAAVSFAAGHWFVDVLYVRPAARGQGIGRALLREVSSRAAAAGIEILELEVLESNDAARRLYDRLGFSTVERILAAPTGTAAQETGANLGAVYVQTDDLEAVERDVAKFLPRLGRGESEAAKSNDSWVRVRADVADDDPAKLKALAKELSYATGVVVALGIEAGAVVRYSLFDRGAIVDEYLSVPEFHGPLPPGDVIALGANPTVVARTAATPSELPPAADLLAEIANVLGVV